MDARGGRAENPQSPLCRPRNPNEFALAHFAKSVRPKDAVSYCFSKTSTEL